MNPNILYIKKLLLVCLLATGVDSFCQDSTIRLKVDESVYYNFQSTIINSYFDYDYLYQSPGEEARRTCRKYSHLINEKPGIRTYENYYKVACALWDLNRLREAEQMFLNIVSSTGPYYTTTYRHSSDVPGDTNTYTYGYGSYTSNYKNGASIYLTKIYIKQKQFKKALSFLEVAVNKYEVTYTCGTGYWRQKERYDFLYAAVYEGLGEYDKAIAILLPEPRYRDDQLLLRIIKKKYSATEIKETLLEAENSIQCVFDTIPSYATQTIYSSSSKIERTDTLIYYSGSAIMNLFGRIVDLPAPTLSNGERATKERFLKEFKESPFYKELAKTVGLIKEEVDSEDDSE